MTWTWTIHGQGSTNQTLEIIDPDGTVVASKESDGFSWSGEYPNIVYEIVADHDTVAAIKEDIERVQS